MAQKQIYALAILLVAGIFSFQNLKAQSEFGVKGGINFSRFLISDDQYLGYVEQQFKNGLTLGFYYDQEKLLGPLGFRAELLYQSKGTNMFLKNYDHGDGYGYGYSPGYGYSFDSWYRNHEKLHYVTVPLLLTVAPFRNMKLYAGNHIGLLVDYTSSRRTVGTQKQRFSYGLDAGAVIRFNEYSAVDLRWSQDLTRFDNFNIAKSSALKNISVEITYQHTFLRK